ncbi:DUF6493 family protein [Spirillospora sp. CA-142024]|uniref:DUF6493 family protein n=1 Tax=Spirillospora sp. CA-142024 TaxID=3240036 RepID=UPI003D8D3E81
MSAWDEIRKAIDSGDLDRTARLVAGLDDTARREVAKQLPGRLKDMRAASEYGFLDRTVLEPLLLTGAGTIGGAAAAATWLCRRDLRLWWSQDRYARLCTALCAVTSIRPDEWRAEVARRVADRLRVSDGEWALWHIAAALTRSAGAAPPLSDGFVVGWVTDGVLPHDLAGDPFLDALVPKLFESDGVGAALASDESRLRWDKTRAGTWADALADLARTGRLDRAPLLDGCVSRFLRGGTPHNLRWFVRLHDALEPTEDEAVAHVRDYVRLLPAAPSTVAAPALRQVRRADEQGRLDDALFEEAAGAVLFRPEKKLVQTTLTWLDRSARKRDRVDATLRAVAAVFASDALDLRERAVKIAVRHADRASGAVREEIRGAAADLPAALREAIATAFGEVEAPAEPEPTMGPPPFVPREALAPIGSLAELAEEFVLLLRAPEEWRAAERFLAALVEFAYRDPEATRAALRKAADGTAQWITNAEAYPYMRGHVRSSWIQFPVQSLLVPATPHGLFSVLGSFLKGRSRKSGTVFEPQMQRFLTLRRHEIASAVGKVPVLLATPTEGSGHVDPGALVGRLERLEKAGAEPGRSDLTQAMLRVPRDIDAAAVVRAKNLTSTAGRAVASWLAEGGLADPGVACEVLDEPVGRVGDRKLRLPTRVLSTVDVPGDSDIAHLCAFPEEGWTDFGRPTYNVSTTFWPSVLPSHREVAAAHLVPYLAGTDDSEWEQGAVMLDLAEAGGPTGAATGTLLAYALANRHADERVNAVEALLAFSAQGALPAAETGTALGRLTSFKRVTLPRAVKALTTAADAGAHAGVWTIIGAALPHALPAPGERAATGLPDLLALATRLAETTGARGPIPAVEAAASRGGSSRLVKEAARLARTLAT